MLGRTDNPESLDLEKGKEVTYALDSCWEKAAQQLNFYRSALYAPVITSPKF
jgi:hypothetical protein